MHQRLILSAGGVLLSAGLLVAACGDDDATSDAPTTEVPTTGAGTSTTTTAVTTTTTEADEGTVIEVGVRGGEVQGGGRREVDLGDTVTLRVTSDVDDAVHVHGYDLFVDVAAGETAELTFTADIPGVFEVELEDRHLSLLELQVS